MAPDNKEKNVQHNENEQISEEEKTRLNPFKKPVADIQKETPAEEAEEEQQRKEAMTERD